jgi:hypothetical protein
VFPLIREFFLILRIRKIFSRSYDFNLPSSLTIIIPSPYYFNCLPVSVLVRFYQSNDISCQNNNMVAIFFRYKLSQSFWVSYRQKLILNKYSFAIAFAFSYLFYSMRDRLTLTFTRIGKETFQLGDNLYY